jgi:hypothetical protein
MSLFLTNRPIGVPRVIPFSVPVNHVLYMREIQVRYRISIQN